MREGREGDQLLIVTNNRQRVFQRSIIAGVLEVGAHRDYQVEVREIPRHSDANGLLDELSDSDAGLMLIADVLPDDAIAALHEAGRSITLVSHQVPGLEVASIVHDNSHGIELLAAEVFERCSRRAPVYIRGSGRQRDAVERESAFRRELMRRDLPVDEDRFLDGGFEPTQAAEAMQRFLTSGGSIDALVAADYLMAISCLEVLRSCEYDVPSHVVVTGFGDGPEAEAAGLTTVAADVVELGRRAARQLAAQREGMQIRGLTLLSTMLVRRSTSS